VNNVASSLNNIALVCGGRKYDDVRRESNPINTWDELKRELKKQFYPDDAKYEARPRCDDFSTRMITFEST